MPRVTFRAKVVEPTYMDGTPAPRYVKVPKLTSAHYSRKDFAEDPRYRSYSNSDLLPSMIKRAVHQLGVREHINPDAPIPGVTVDTSGFLARVSIDI